MYCLQNVYDFLMIEDWLISSYSQGGVAYGDLSPNTFLFFLQRIHYYLSQYLYVTTLSNTLTFLCSLYFHNLQCIGKNLLHELDVNLKKIK